MSYYNFFITPIQIERIFQIINRMKNLKLVFQIVVQDAKIRPK